MKHEGWGRAGREKGTVSRGRAGEVPVAHVPPQSPVTPDPQAKCPETPQACQLHCKKPKSC